MRLLLLALLLTTTAQAQWDLEDSHTTASLRGIHTVGGGIAWASGTNGTVLRTTNDGKDWQTCALPPGAEKLDLRGIQAFDANTAIVMSSGKGDQSRLYKTTNGCRTWKLLFTNPDKEGFWDAIQYDDANKRIIVLGDPVDGAFKLFAFSATAATAKREAGIVEPKAETGESIFAASNSSMIVSSADGICFVTGGSAAEMICTPLLAGNTATVQTRSPLPLRKSESAGAFSIGDSHTSRRVVVGGDYQKPGDTTGTASWSDDWGLDWHPAQTPPHGYRSAVAYDPHRRLWIAVGPNGTDLSTDGGKNWRALKPLSDQPPDADRNWNAVSLPFVVGPKGRIGKLDLNALPPSGK